MFVTEQSSKSKYSDVFFAIEQAVVHTPEKIAARDTEQQLTYKQLKVRVESLSAQIRLSGATSGEIIGLCLDRSVDILVSMLACLKTRCAFFPISQHIPVERFNYLLEDSGVSRVIAYSKAFPGRKGIQVISPLSTEATYSLFKEAPTPHQLAYLLYTSGSTGLPKGVLIEYHSMMNLFDSLTSKIGFCSSDVFLALTDYTFDVALIELLLPLTLGATVVIADHGSIVDGYRIQTYLKQYPITVMQATPTTWELLLKSGWKNEAQFKILVGGEVFQTSLANQLGWCHGNVWNLYGPTETTMWSTLYYIHQSLNTASVPIGTPVANTSLLVLDEHLQLATEGELYIGGRGVARSYYHKDELTEKCFVHLDDTPNRYYKTGDIVRRLPDGNLVFLHRADNQIKIGGVRIEPAEIEHVLKSFPFVQRAAVVSQGEGYCKQLVAFIEYDEAALYKHYRPYYENKTVKQWKDIYDTTHQNAHDQQYCHNTINTCGWISELTHQAFSFEELEENIQLLVNKLKQVNLDRVLEVGCGTGNVFQKIMPFVKNYTGVDVSAITVEHFKNIIPEHLKPHCHAMALNITAFTSEEKFTCVIANSVIQYFPSSSYLIEVIEKLIHLTEEGGSIVFGDIRSTEMMELFFLQKNEFSKNHSTLSTYLKSREEELIISPDFFTSLMKHFPRIKQVDIDLKRGRFDNELNIYRYDAVIYLDTPVERKSVKTVNWNSVKGCLSELFTPENDEIIHLTQVPNIFLEKTLQALYAREVKLPYGIISDDEKKAVMWLVGQTTNEHHFIHFLYDHDDPLHYITVIKSPNIQQGLIRGEGLGSDLIPSTLREPFSPVLNEHLSQALSLYVASKLPPLLCPSSYYWVDRWPVTFNQKIDRKILASVAARKQTVNASNNKMDILHRLYFNVMHRYIPAHVPILSSGISSLTIHHFISQLNEHFSSILTLNDLNKDLTLEGLANILE